MNILKHNYDPNPTQVAFHESNVRYKGFKGSKGSGKTRAIVEETVALLHEFPGNRGIMARKNFDDLRETTMLFFLEACPDELIIQHNKAESWVLIESCDKKKPSRLKFAHSKEPKSFESGEIGVFVLDETDEIPYETYQTLCTRLRLKGVAHYGLVAFNPTNPFHWLYRYFKKDIVKKPELAKSRRLFENNTMENIGNLPSGYIDELKNTYQGDDLNRYLYGEWGSISNEWAVWPEFRESIHIAKQPIEIVRGIDIIRAHDFGMWAGVSFHQFVEGQWRILYPDMLEFGKGAEQLAPLVLQNSFQYFPDSAVIDISEPYARNRASADASLTCVKAYKENGIPNLKILDNSWADRMGSVAYFLSRLQNGEPAFQVDPRCERVIKALSGAYQFEDNTHEKTANRVKDNEHTHLADTLQMAACYFKNSLNKAKVSIPRPKSYQFKTIDIPAHRVIGGKTVLKRRGRL